MLSASTRSGLVETVHDGAIAVVGADGDLIASSGDIHRPFYLRSSAKPFQAHVAQREGAALRPVELALASASHDGNPVHVAIVEEMLDTFGLGAEDLGCPPDWPASGSAVRTLARQGHERRRRVWHNCSGKHVAWLRACKERGWSAIDYLDPAHPLQLLIFRSISEFGDYSVAPLGIDGCGAPVLRTTARVMALLFARLGSLPELRAVFTSLHRYPALVSGTGNGDAAIATAINAVAKSGSGGCLGVGLDRRFGIGVKSWDGIEGVATVAAVAALEALGALTQVASERLAAIGRPLVWGGDQVVGEMEPRVELRWS